MNESIENNNTLADTVFQDVNFDCVKYLENISKNNTSLNELSNNLMISNENLKNQLIDLLNEKYTDFISLSNNLTNTDEYISNILQELLPQKDYLQSSYHEICTLVQHINKTLKHQYKNNLIIKRLKNIHITKTYLIEIKNLFNNKISDDINVDDDIVLLYQSLLYSSSNKFDNYQQQQQQDIINNSELCERIARKIQFIKNILTNNLLNDINKDDLLYINQQKIDLKQLENEIIKETDIYCNKLEVLLTNTFKEAFKLQHISCLNQILRATIYSHNIKQLEQYIANDIINNYLPQILSKKVLLSLFNNELSLQQCYDLIDNKLFQLYQYVKILIAQENDQSVEYNNEIDFIINSILKALVVYISTNLDSTTLYASGTIQQFHHNYQCIQYFLKQYQSMFYNKPNDHHQQKIFYQTQIVQKLLKGFKLYIYYQVINRQIIHIVKDLFHDQIINIDHIYQIITIKQDQFQLHQTNRFMDILSYIWHDQIYLSKLCNNFFQLTILLISNYYQWLLNLNINHLFKAQAKQSQAKKLPEDQLKEEKDEIQAQKYLLTIYKEIDQLYHYVPNFLYQLIIQHHKPIKLNKDQSSIKKIIDQTIMIPYINKLKDEYQVDILNKLSNHILTTCNQILTNIERISKFIQPTSHSSYIELLLKPLISYKDINTTFLINILDQITISFYNKADKILKEVYQLQKTISSLKKLIMKIINKIIHMIILNYNYNMILIIIFN